MSQIGKLVLHDTDREANFVDEQLTKDHIPVIYHDFLVPETRIDTPMYTITHDQVRFHLRSLNTNQLMIIVHADQQ